MYIVHVHVHVVAGGEDSFLEATARNAAASRQTESGVLRFDVVQHCDEPSRFVLVEVYADAGAATLHKDTDHYNEWRTAVADLMAVDRYSVKMNAVSPLDESGWRSGECSDQAGEILKCI